LEARVLISVIISTYNRKEILKRSLEAIFQQNFPSFSYEVIVVVDGSTDGTEQLLKGLHPLCLFRYILQENLGLAAARNRGAREAKGEILLFLDDDIIACPQLLTEHYNHHGEGRDLVLGNIPLYPALGWSDYMTEGTRKWAEEQFQRLARGDQEITYKDIYFANASIRRDLFFQLGGFDEQFRSYGLEDREFAYRLIKAGVRPLYNHQAIGYQFYEKDFKTYCRDYFHIGKGEVRLVKKYPELWPQTRLSSYWQASLLRRLLRKATIDYPRSTRGLMTLITGLMEGARRLHLRGNLLNRAQAFIRDHYYWSGVREELGNREEFLQLVKDQASHGH